MDAYVESLPEPERLQLEHLALERFRLLRGNRPAEDFRKSVLRRGLVRAVASERLGMGEREEVCR